jgi:HEAT repeat protein
MRKRLWVILIGIAALASCLLLVPSVRTIVIGLCRGEQVYRGKPTSYWSRALTDREAGGISATIAVLQRGGTRAVPVLLEALESDDGQVRLNAALALGALGNEAVPALVGALENGSPVVRVGAARALQRMGPGAAEAIPALGRALRDSEPLVVRMAIGALGRAGKESVPILIDIFQSPQNPKDVRLAALEALGNLGADAAAAVPVLLKASEEEDDPIGERAGEAVKKIEAARQP